MADGDESDDVSDVNPDELAKMMEVRFKIVFLFSYQYCIRERRLRCTTSTTNVCFDVDLVH